MARIKLVEKIVVKPTQIKRLPLTESKDIVSEGTTYKCISAYTFPISRPGEKNLNERIYPKELWENVINNKMAESSYGLMDHPDGEGSTKDSWCVWHNIRFSEDKKLVVADAYLFGKWGKHVHEALEAGGEVGLSTVGLGEFLEDEMTINPDTYELERASDFVLNPSYGVYGNIEDKKVEESPVVSEELPTIKEESGDVVATKTDTKESGIMENTKEKKVSKLQEKNFRLQINNLIKDACALEDIHKRRAEFIEILTYFEEGFAEDLRETVETKIAEIDTQIKELADKGLELDSTQKANEDLKKTAEDKDKRIEELEKEIEGLSEQLTNSTQLNQNLKVFTKRLETQVKEKQDQLRIKEAEINGMISPTEYKELSVYCGSLEKDYKELKVESRRLKQELKLSGRKAKKEQVNESKEEKPVVVKEAKEKLLDLRNDDIVFEYYCDLIEADPRVEQIKEEILSCKTYIEAQQKYLILKPTLEGEEDVIKELEKREVYEGDSFKVNRTKTDAVNDQDASYEDDNLPLREGWL